MSRRIAASLVGATRCGKEPRTNRQLHSILVGLLSLAVVTPCHLQAVTVGFIYSNGVTSIFPQAINIYHINDSGDFVGGTPGAEAFLYHAGVLTDLGHGAAYSINNNGEVVGIIGLHAFSYQNGVFTDLGIPFGNFASIAQAVNDSGAIAGYSESNVNTPGVRQTSWLIDGASTTNLGTLPGGLDRSGAVGMNNLSQIVGDAQVSPGVNHMFIWSPSTGMVDLGLGVGGANAINNQGYVAGFFEPPGDGAHAFLYHNGTTIDLQQSVFGPAGWLGSAATAINDAGQIVGNGCYPDAQVGCLQLGFLLTPDNHSSSGYDLTRLGQYDIPMSVNNLGVVVGKTEVNSLTPEPSTLLLVTGAFLVGGTTLQLRRRRAQTWLP